MKTKAHTREDLYDAVMSAKKGHRIEYHFGGFLSEPTQWRTAALAETGLFILCQSVDKAAPKIMPRNFTYLLVRTDKKMSQALRRKVEEIFG